MNLISHSFFKKMWQEVLKQNKTEYCASISIALKERNDSSLTEDEVFATINTKNWLNDKTKLDFLCLTCKFHLQSDASGYIFPNVAQQFCTDISLWKFTFCTLKWWSNKGTVENKYLQNAQIDPLGLVKFLKQIQSDSHYLTVLYLIANNYWNIQ